MRAKSLIAWGLNLVGGEALTVYKQILEIAPVTGLDSLC